MGANLTMIDRHYGHLARDEREHAIRLLDELSAGQRSRWTLVDAGGRCVDADASSRRQPGQQKHQLSKRKPEALFRTRTGDPLLTMEVLYQLS
jgi:hypothetical protein